MTIPLYGDTVGSIILSAEHRIKDNDNVKTKYFYADIKR